MHAGLVNKYDWLYWLIGSGITLTYYDHCLILYFISVVRTNQQKVESPLKNPRGKGFPCYACKGNPSA